MTPISIRRVLVAVDFGDASRQALVAGGLIARPRGRGAPGARTPNRRRRPRTSRTNRSRRSRRSACAWNRRRERSSRRSCASTPTPRSRRHSSRRPPADAILHHLADGGSRRHGHARTARPAALVARVGCRAGAAADRSAAPRSCTRPIDRTAMFERIGVFAAPTRSGARAFEFATALAASLGVPLNDHRREEIDAAAMHHHASLVIVPMPCPHDRRWLSEIGEPLVRAAAGPVLFVPDREVSGGSS